MPVEKAIFAALHKIPRNWISVETGVVVLRVGIGTVALRLSLLKELPATSEPLGEKAITVALDAILSEIFADGVDAEANWNLARNSTLQRLVEIALSKLAKCGATEKDIAELRVAVRELIEKDAPFDPDGFATRLA